MKFREESINIGAKMTTLIKNKCLKTISDKIGALKRKFVELMNLERCKGVYESCRSKMRVWKQTSASLQLKRTTKTWVPNRSWRGSCTSLRSWLRINCSWGHWKHERSSFCAFLSDLLAPEFPIQPTPSYSITNG